MTADAAAPHDEEDRTADRVQCQGGINTALLGMLLFIGSELMFFAGLFAAYFNARAAGLPAWPPQGVDFINPIPLPTHRDRSS